MIQINELEKNYPDFHLKLSLSLPAGRITGIVGRNGAGKTTVIKAVLGLIVPDGGSVTVFGKPACELTGTDRERWGVALAESGFSNYITVDAVNRIQRKLYSRYDEALFLRLVREQGLPMNKPIKEFSTGMKAKLRVLAAMTHKAKLLILDEPTAGLDVIARNEILDLLRAYMAEDEERSILITSHISSDLEGLCDDICMIHNGEVIFHEDTDAILDRYAVLKVSEAEYQKLDRQYIITARPCSFGYVCLTGERQYFAENHPGIVMENGGIDELIVMLASSKGEVR